MNVLAEKLMGAVSVCGLLAAIAAFSDHVNLPLPATLASQPLEGFGTAGASLERLATVVTAGIALYTGANTVMVCYGLASLVILALMLRS